MPAEGNAGKIMFVGVFVLFTFAVSQLGGPSLVGSTPESVQSPPFDTGACDIGGFDVVVDVVVCAVDTVGFFKDLIITDTPYFLLKYGFLIPMGMMVLFIVVVVIRGGGS